MAEPWNSLEVAKLVVGLLTPLAVVGLGWLVSRRLKHLEHAQWANQKVIENRLAFYERVAPQLNALLCFFTWVGYWKDISPPAAVQLKRELDKQMHIHRHLFDDAVFDSYQAFVGLLFQTYTGLGHDAKLRSAVVSRDGNRRERANYAWKAEWEAPREGLFADRNEAPIVDKPVVRAAYLLVMQELCKSLGTPLNAPRGAGTARASGRSG